MSIPDHIKKDFPIFQHHPRLVYLDSAATSLKPKPVVEAEREYYEQYGVNVHRGVYALSVKATEAYEGAREKVRQFINAKSTKEIVFVRGATEGINLVASSLARQFVSGDAVLLSEMEHHANIVPWLPPPRRDPPSLGKLGTGRAGGLTSPAATPPGAGGVELRWIPVTTEGQLDLSNIDELLKDIKLLAITQMSNVLGTVNDVKTLAHKAHAVGAMILVDAAQSAPHMPVDVQDLDCDFLVFSGHKMLGPTGIGVLYARQELLEQMEPYQRGGDMILEVTKERATWNELPWRFEAGTPNIAGAIGLGAAVDYLQNIGMENVWGHERELAEYGLQKLAGMSGVTVLGAPSPPPRPPSGRGVTSIPPSLRDRPPSLGKLGTGRTGEQNRGAIFSFTMDGVHPHDIGSILDEQGIAVRAGHHCAMPLHQKFGLVATTRASCYLYNTKEDIDALVKGIVKLKEVFS